MKDLEVVSRPMPSWRVQQTFVPGLPRCARDFACGLRRPQNARSLAALGISPAGSDARKTAQLRSFRHD